MLDLAVHVMMVEPCHADVDERHRVRQVGRPLAGQALGQVPGGGARAVDLKDQQREDDRERGVAEPLQASGAGQGGVGSPRGHERSSSWPAFTASQTPASGRNVIPEFEALDPWGRGAAADLGDRDRDRAGGHGGGARGAPPFRVRLAAQERPRGRIAHGALPGWPASPGAAASRRDCRPPARHLTPGVPGASARREGTGNQARGAA